MGQGLRRDLRAAVAPWLVSRLVVVGALATMRFLYDDGRLAPSVAKPSLFEWDASFYREIARHGYDAAIRGHDGLRFFPLYPLVARALGGSDVVLLVVASVTTLAFLSLLHGATIEWADPRAAERVLWLAALGPGAIATVMGYAEPLYLLFAVACLWAATHTPSSARLACAAGVAGALSAFARPLGVLLALAIVVEGARRRDRLMVLAGVGPIAGIAAFLAWSAHAGYGFLEPLRLQSKANLRGELVDPARALWSATHDAIAHHRVGPAVHVVFAVAAIALIPVAWKRLPRGVALFGIAALALSLTSRNLDSFERYLLGAFPLLVAAATLRSNREVDRAVVALLAAALAITSLLAFAGASVP